MSLKVLITGAGAVLGQGIFHALKRSNLNARIAAADPSPLAPALFWADEAYQVPLASDASYIDGFAEVLSRARPDIVLVGTDVELPALARERMVLEQAFNTHILVSDVRVVAIADDKYQTFQFLRDANLNPPGSALPEDREELESLLEQVGYPLVVKPRIGARSVGVSVVDNRATLNAALQGRSGLIVQECIANEEAEFTSSALVFDGHTTASIVMRRDLRDGNTYRAYAEPYQELNQQVRSLGRALKPYGPANFQFRVDAQGLARVFEINARFSGATPLRALVGFNEVEMCVRKIVFGEEITQPVTQPAIILRHWTETMINREDIDRIS